MSIQYAEVVSNVDKVIEGEERRIPVDSSRADKLCILLLGVILGVWVSIIVSFFGAAYFRDDSHTSNSENPMESPHFRLLQNMTENTVSLLTEAIHTAKQLLNKSQNLPPPKPPEPKSEPELPYSAIACGDFPRPKVATCFAGTIRTLAHTSMYRSIKTNLVDALGADMKLFFYLGRGDHRGDSRSQYGRLVPDTSEEDLQNVLAYLSPAKVMFDNITDWHTIVNEQCPFAGSQFQMVGFDYLRGFVAQLWGKKTCYEMIAEYEEKHEMKFDVVIKTRPDYQWYLPVPPYCFKWDFTQLYNAHDWAYSMPRESAEAVLFGPWKTYQECTTEQHHKIVESFTDAYHQDAGLEFEKRLDLLPGLVLRPPGKGYPTNLCGWGFPEGNEGLCHRVTDRNPFNKLPDRSIDSE